MDEKSGIVGRPWNSKKSLCCCGLASHPGGIENSASELVHA